MSPAGIWQEIGAGENVLTKFLRLIFLHRVLFSCVPSTYLAAAGSSWRGDSVHRHLSGARL